MSEDSEFCADCGQKFGEKKWEMKKINDITTHQMVRRERSHRFRI